MIHACRMCRSVNPSGVGARRNPYRDHTRDEDEVRSHNNKPEEILQVAVPDDACEGDSKGGLGPGDCESRHSGRGVMVYKEAELVIVGRIATRDGTT